MADTESIVYMNNPRGLDHVRMYGEGAFFDLNTWGQQERLARELRPGQRCVVATKTDDGRMRFRWYSLSHEEIRETPEGPKRVFYGGSLKTEVLEKEEATRDPVYQAFFDVKGNLKRATVPRLTEDGSREDHWTDAELRGAVSAYLEMLQLQREGRKYTKSRYFQNLATRFSRTAKAFEYRAQNISHVLALQGRSWVSGLLPARNVGAKVVARIERILAELEDRPLDDIATFESRVRASLRRGNEAPPRGSKTPRSGVGSTTRYERDPEVKAWVLRQARGTCESCEKPAPFTTHDGIPFLEVHHIRRLADGGSDRVQNAVAVCPDCHRALHYSRDREERIKRLFNRISRLERE